MSAAVTARLAEAPGREAGRDLELERQLIEISQQFDGEYYVKQAGLAAADDPIHHYVTKGWLIGLQPNAEFPGFALHSYYRVFGRDEPPLVTWLVQRASGWFSPESYPELEHYRQITIGSSLFDEAYYREQLPGFPRYLDAVTHYILFGEQLGIRPSDGFDPMYYRTRYPDTVQAKFPPLRHYAEYGRAEGRHPRAPEPIRKGKVKADPSRRNVLLVVHETTRTGAPILGWNIGRVLAAQYNLQVIHLGEGELTGQFEELCTEIMGPFSWAQRVSIDLEGAVRALVDERRVEFAIVNSAESRFVIEPLVRTGIPTLLLVHEFGAYVYPAHTFRAALDWTTEVVFPAKIVAEAALNVHPHLAQRVSRVLPQGPSLLPPVTEAAKPARKRSEAELIIDELLQEKATEGTFFVLGAGAVQIRKGVEIFIATAASVARRATGRKIRFVWVGHGYSPKEDMAYSMYLREQLERSDAKHNLTFVDAVSDLDAVYAMSDVLFLSSRLDPLPNVSIDAAFLGKPLVCFRDASGTAELLEGDETASLAVVDHLDPEAAAEIILRLAADDDLYERMSSATREFARKHFDMDAYVGKLQTLGENAGRALRARAQDAATLLADGTFDSDMFLGTSDVVEDRKRTIEKYLALGAARGWKRIEVADTELRRPAPGFNPRLFAAAYPETLSGEQDPLATYVREGKPAGPWQAEVLRPGDLIGPMAEQTLSACLHCHIYYPDLAQDLLARLNLNRSRVDLLVTTDTEEKAELLRTVFYPYAGGTASVSVVPNRGRDLGPLLTALDSTVRNYDVVGHIHTKRSVGKEGWSKGDEWREFLWQNLVGGLHPMMDRVLVEFASKPALGLVFPSDPHLVGWDENLPVAQQLAERFGWEQPLPKTLDFPLGCMFWARTAALQPLYDLGLQWGDYPEEPVGQDGTLLHALERMLPVICCDMAGFQYAVTHIFGVSWTA